MSFPDMRTMRAASGLLLCLCACAGVQRAEVGAPIVTAVEVARVEPLGPARAALVHGERSSVAITSGTLFASFESRITRFRGRLRVDEARRGDVSVVFDMTSFENPSRTVTAILQYEFLEIDRHPTATFEGRLEPAGGDDVHVRGVLDLHGVRRPIAFDGRLVRDAEGWLFTTTFDLDRHEWDLRQHDEWDWLNRSSVRVSLSLRGTPETVTVEE